MEAAAPLLAVAGPTSSGKTLLGLELARRLGAEVVSADSRQIYRRLDAGTGKPPGAWQEGPSGRLFLVAGIPHHLIDVLDPRDGIDAGRFAAMAAEALAGAASRGRRALVVGGTGLYLRALLQGLDPLPPRSIEIREALAELAEANGREWLHEELARVDPQAARRIPPNNLQRVVRALEVHRLTGRPISQLWTGGARAGAAGPTLIVGLRWSRRALESRIRSFCARVFPAVLDEVRRLVPSEYDGREPGFQSLGYPQAIDAAAGRLTEREGLAAMERAALAYAKRQATWFRRQEAVAWIDAEGASPAEWADRALGILAQVRGPAA